MIYKIEHFYSIGRSKCKYAILIESDIEPQLLSKIIGAIQLKFEELQDDEDCIDELHLLDLLKSYYGVRDVKDKYNHLLKQTVLPDDKWRKIVHIPVRDDLYEYEIIQIDIHESREALCGPKYKETYKYLPIDEQFILELKDLSKFYLS